jgi:hypothetical protein
LVYSVLDADGNRVGQPLKSSLFGKRYGIAALETMMLKSGEVIKSGNMATKTKAIVSAALAGSRDGSEFRVRLREKGIDLVLRHNDGGRLYGVTFIDHNSRTVLNGSALGKEFSAGALSARFADLTGGVSEQAQPITTAPQTTTQTQSDTGGPTIVVALDHDVTPTYTAPTDDGTTSHAALGNDEAPAQAMPDAPASGQCHGGAPSGGGLLSLLTPEPGPSSDNGPSAPKRRKKKRQYGRQY